MITAQKPVLQPWFFFMVPGAMLNNSTLNGYMLKKRPEKYLRFAAKACSKDEQVIEEITDIMFESKHAAPFIRSQVGNYDYLDVIENMKIPYLIIKGPHDKSINKSLDKHIKRFESQENIEVRSLDDAGHFLNLDHPEKFNDMVHTFLTRIASP